MSKVARRRAIGIVLIAIVVACRSPQAAAPPPRPAEIGPVAESRRAPLDLSPLPDRRHGHRAEALPDGRVVVFGGFDHFSDSEDRGMRTTWVFDPGKRAWARAGDLNTPMAFHGSVVTEGSVFAIGGNVERFDAGSGTWKLILDGRPFADSHLAAAAAGRQVLIAGGFPDSRPRLAMLDLAARTWHPVPEYPGLDSQDHFSYLAAFDEIFHVAGGLSDFQPVTRHHAWDGKVWLPRAPVPMPDATKFAAWAVDVERGRLIMFGMNGNHAYDARRDAWTPLPPPPWQGFRVMPATFIRDGYLYVLGGTGEGDRKFGVDVFDLLAGRWLQ